MLGVRILGPSFKVILHSQVKLWVSEYVLLGSAIRPLFAEPVTNIHVEAKKIAYIFQWFVLNCCYVVFYGSHTC